MNEKQQAADELKRFATMLQGIPAIAADLDRLGSLDQAELEAKGRVAKLQADERASKDRVAGFEAEYAKKRDEAKKQSDDLRAAAEKVVDDANEQAEKIVADANAKRDRIIADADSKRADMASEISKSQVQLTSLKGEIKNAQATLDDINSQIDMVRKRISGG